MAEQSVRVLDEAGIEDPVVSAVHRQLLAHCQPLDGAQDLLAVPAQRKARREYENRVSTLTPGP
ncbi:hypothetical protein Sgleb_51330 [Streptomyces glebosus]|uniref:Uncharacterized protein n=1 Tax=Streptomyces glebosus TaxID=249580 RepID=A0A640T478_9ACTN|nr:hypothetical protein [Streptomyces glebosus]GFE17086.1 hypothetical protein Sgleb_51330 [Streptomyces glebosus]GHG53460.1 hypothetical protein GCM10010513_14270 [Streptomyces glebosus]